MLTDEVLAYVFNGEPHLLTETMTTWLTSSRQFTTFANTFRDKIRKKIRVTKDYESIGDLRLELETAYLLLQERSLSLVYEPLQAERSRNPDFAVTYTTSLTFMVEVTRLRAEQKNTSTGPHDDRLADAICSKLGQLQPQCSNVLLVGVETLQWMESDLRATMLHIQHRVQQGDSAFLQRYRFRNRGDFFQQYQRLSEVLVRAQNMQAQDLDRTDSHDSLLVWVNPQAKHPLPGKVRTALYRSHGR